MNISRRAPAILLLALLGGAAWLRVSGLGFGPDVDARPDEGAVLVTMALIDEPGAALSPMQVTYGGGFFYPLYAVTKVWSLWAWPAGLVDAVRHAFHRLVVVARAWSALLSTATILVTFFAARSLLDVRAGFAAAVLLAASPLAVREAHFAKADSAAALSAALVVLALAIPPSHPIRWAVSIGAAAALAVSTKLNVWILPACALALLCAPAPSEGRSRLRSQRVRWATATFVLCALLLHASAVLRPGQAKTILETVPTVMEPASWLPGVTSFPHPAAYLAMVSLRYGCGRVLQLLVAPAIVFGLARGGSMRFVAVAAIGPMVPLLFGHMLLARFLLPALPGLCVLAGALLVTGVDRLNGSFWWRTAILGGVLAVCLAEPLGSSIALGRRLRQDDTRTLAGNWIDQHVPRDARVVCIGAPPGVPDYGCPPTHGRRVQTKLPESKWGAANVGWVVLHQYPIPYSSAPTPPSLKGRVPAAVFDPFVGPRDRAIFEPIDAFYLPLGGLEAVDRPGPRIEIHRVSPVPSAGGGG